MPSPSSRQKALPSTPHVRFAFGGEFAHSKILSTNDIRVLDRRRCASEQKSHLCSDFACLKGEYVPRAPNCIASAHHAVESGLCGSLGGTIFTSASKVSQFATGKRSLKSTVGFTAFGLTSVTAASASATAVRAQSAMTLCPQVAI